MTVPCKSTKKFWTFVKSKKRIKFVCITALENQGKVYSDSLSKANPLNNQFASVFTHEDLSQIPRMSGNQVPDIPDVDIQKKVLQNCYKSYRFT